MTKAELRKLKYRAIKNTYHDTKLAQQAREWSEERILYELGIKLPKTTPKLRKDVTAATKKRKENELKKFKSIRDRLLLEELAIQKALELAIKNKSKSNKFITQLIKQHEKKIYQDNYVDDKGYNLYSIFDQYKTMLFDDRVKSWSAWAKNDDYPFEFEEIARIINLEKKLDSDHHLGWAVVYQSFIHNQDPNKLKNYYKVHDFHSEHYQGTHKLKKG